MEKYVDLMAKIVDRAKKDGNWSIHFGFEEGQSIIIDQTSETKDILKTISLFTTNEFDHLTKGYEDLDIKEYHRRNPYDTTAEENGIYVEVCEPSRTLTDGRHYAIVKDNKKMSADIFTARGEKNVSYNISERDEDGIYIYLSSTDEIRLVSNDRLKELCDLNRGLLGKTESELSDGEIINYLNASESIYSLGENNGKVLANNVRHGKPATEDSINHIFTIGLSEYMKLYGTTVTESYEKEISEVENWQR